MTITQRNDSELPCMNSQSPCTAEYRRAHPARSAPEPTSISSTQSRHRLALRCGPCCDDLRGPGECSVTSRRQRRASWVASSTFLWVAWNLGVSGRSVRAASQHRHVSGLGLAARLLEDSRSGDVCLAGGSSMPPRPSRAAVSGRSTQRPAVSATRWMPPAGHPGPSAHRPGSRRVVLGADGVRGAERACGDGSSWSVWVTWIQWMWARGPR